jgi:uncharacterized protein YacL
LLRSGLLEGQVIVAQAVIDELQALADSSNNEKRGKGRRGLKLLSGLREEVGRRLVINTTRYEGKGADEKLLQLTADTGGTLLTADYNLAQVARVQELRVVNLSELVIALRPEVQPGDTLQLKIVREGKEADQGVGYLEDGTMVVVEEARKRIGERLPVTVTGALQTPTGRMVFARQERERGKETGERAKETGERIKETGERGKGAAEAARTGGVERGGKGENGRGASERGKTDPHG